MKNKAVILLVAILGIVIEMYQFLNRNAWIGLILTGALFLVYIAFRKRLKKKNLGFLGLVLISLGITILTGPRENLVPATYEEAEKTQTVRVNEGELRGVYNKDKSVEVYAGIPYAKPPVGNLRWKEPQDPKKYEGILEADHFAPMSMQKKSNVVGSSIIDMVFYHNYSRTINTRYIPKMSEDSLYLNIWKPSNHEKTDKKLPVVFYIHGGSLTSGQSWWPDYNGEPYAKQDVIFVTFAYRLGAMGFYADEQLAKESPNSTTGMYGFLDQVKALEWVNKNIENFGGDKSNITIAGESAGSSSVNAMCTSPLAKGLFKRAIAESSSITALKPAHSYMDIREALARGESLRKELNASSIEDLRKVPAEKIANTKTEYGILNAMTNDGYGLKKSPYETYMAGENNEKSLLMGYNDRDGDLFMVGGGKVTADNYDEKLKELYPIDYKKLVDLYPAKNDEDAKENLAKIYTAGTFGYGHEVWSNLASKRVPVYRYLFTKSNKTVGSNHTGELYYAYGSMDQAPYLFDESDRELGRIMMGYWINFAKTGNPNGKGLVRWDEYDGTRVMEFGRNVKMIEDTFKPIYRVLEK